MLRIARIKHDCWLLQGRVGTLYKPGFSLTHSQSLTHTLSHLYPNGVGRGTIIFTTVGAVN